MLEIIWIEVHLLGRLRMFRPFLICLNWKINNAQFVYFMLKKWLAKDGLFVYYDCDHQFCT
jgi:hypothetical protein